MPLPPTLALTFLNPTGGLIAAAIAAPLLVLLYFLKLRRRPLLISSTLLWRRSVHDLEVNTPFQRLRRNLLLLLQLLVLSALMLAIARPAVEGGVTEGDRVFILIDRSGSMNATDVSPSRFEAARRKAIELVDGYVGRGGAMVVSFAAEARVEAALTNDRATLRSAIRNIQPTDQPTRLGEAIELIEPFLSPQTAGGEAESAVVYILSDGAVDDPGPITLPAGRVVYRRIGHTVEEAEPDNIAIVALRARRDVQDPEVADIFFRIANFRREEVSIAVDLLDDGQRFDSAVLELPAATGDGPGTTARTKRVRVPHETVLTVRLDVDDVLEADNAAHVLLPAPQRLRVLLVTRGNPALRTAIGSADVDHLDVISPDAYAELDPETLAWSAARQEGYHTIVFDAVSPERSPPVDSLFFGGVPPVAGLERLSGEDGDSRFQRLLDWDRQDPLLEHQVLDETLFINPGRLVLPEGARTLMEGPFGPVMARVSDGRRRHIVTSFELLHRGGGFATTWLRETAFPVFITDALRLLALGTADAEGIATVPGGSPLRVLADVDLDELTYEGPVEVRARVQDGVALLPPFERAGLYRAQQPVASQWQRIAVNMLDELESNPAASESLPVRAGAGALAEAEGEARREVWHWFILLALVLLMLEWLIYTHRMRV